MWIERLDIQGFRSLSREVTFSRGLNIVVGENEAGKSTLHEALIRSLYGFSRQERTRARNRPSTLIERCRPWSGGSYGLSAIVREVGGRDVRIQWDFDRHQVGVFDHSLGTDLSSQVRGGGDEVRLGEWLTGIGLDDFRQVCCIDQHEIAMVRRSPSLGVALQDAVASLGEDVAVEDVLGRLDAFLREVIGVRVDNLAPSPAGRLLALQRERDAVAAELARTRQSREEIERLVAARQELSDARASLELREETMRQRFLLGEATVLEDRLAEATKLAARADAASEEKDTLPADVVEAVRTTLARIAVLDDEDLPRSRRAAEAEADGVAELEQLEAALGVQVDALAAFQHVDTSSQAAVQAGWSELNALRRAQLDPPPAVPVRDESLGRYRAERDELIALTEAGPSSSLRRALWIALVVVSLGLALLIRRLLQRRKSDGGTTTELERRLGEYGAMSIDELDRRVRAEDRAVADAEAVAAELGRRQAGHHERATAIAAELLEALDRSAAGPAETLELRAGTYLEDCQRFGERLALVARLESARRELEQKRGPWRELQGRLDERRRAEDQLRVAYADAGIDASDLAAARGLFDERVAEDAAAEARRHARNTARAALDAVLGGEDLDELAVRAAAARSGYDAHVREHGSLPEPEGGVPATRSDLDEVEEAIRTAREQVTGLTTRIETLETGLPDMAALEERLAELVPMIERFCQARDAIRIAREVLREAATELKEQFAPHLASALTRNLPRVTGERYREAMVDAELNVRVIAVGGIVSVEELSRATQDQVFLVQRLEIARLLAPNRGAVPLLLDDPFAHYDRKRLRFGLELLREIADDRQTILFSEDPDLARLAADVCGDITVTQLLPPSVEGLAAVTAVL